jgi:hypothetical protein
LGKRALIDRRLAFQADQARVDVVGDFPGDFGNVGFPFVIDLGGDVMVLNREKSDTSGQEGNAGEDIENRPNLPPFLLG